MNGIKILILEDQPVARQALLQALQELGQTNLHTANCAEQAFALLKSEKRFDLLICDIQIPGIDGLTFLREAAEVGQIDALIIASAIPSELRQAIQQFARLTGYQVLGDLGRPFTRDELSVLMLRYSPSAPQGPQYGLDELPSATEIQSGLLDGELIPYYQPKLNLRTLEVTGVEALARWQHPQRGLLPPRAFLSVMQHFSFLNAMTQSILVQALGFMREQQLIGKLRLSINLETLQLAEPRLLEALRQILDAEQVPAQSLILEITESSLMRAPLTSIENLVRLRLLGCGVSIDDVGSGLSSLQRVCEMPCNELKLDGSFIRSMTHNSRSRAALDSLMRLADNLGIELVAEGIETQEQLALLQQLNCPTGQGYLFCHPLPGPAFIEWLRQHEASRTGQRSA